MQTRLRSPATVLLAIIALLLAANLAVLSGNEAHAQVPDQPRWWRQAQSHRATAGDDDDGVVLVGISYGMGHIFRLWSDGMVEERVAITFGNGTDPLFWHASRPEWVEIVDLP